MLHAILLQISDHHPGEMGRLSVPRGHELVPLPLLRHVVSANSSHTLPPPIRPIVILPTWMAPSLCGLANTPPGNDHPLSTPITMRIQMTCSQLWISQRLSSRPPSPVSPIRHLTASGSYPSFIHSFNSKHFGWTFSGCLRCRKHPRSDTGNQNHAPLLFPLPRSWFVIGALICGLV